MRWNPELYEKFAGPRLQPGLDLIARMAPPTDNGPIVDLGCGTGTLTDALGQAFNASDRLVGIDHSPEMLAKARGRYPTIAWREGDVSDWQSDRPAAALFSNAVLHWLDDHEALFGR
ncbi:MAG: methyltransferase domain-containing protein, partial [Pseudomonadota bacterium]